MVVLGQAYLPRHVGTASGVTVGLAVTFGGLAAPLLGRYADLRGLHSMIVLFGRMRAGDGADCLAAAGSPATRESVRRRCGRRW